VTSTFPTGITGLAYGNGVYVAAASDQSTYGDAGFIYYSTNGTDWYWAHQSPGAPGLNGVAFGNGVFVAAGYFYEGSQGWVQTSTNGVNWSYQYPAGSNYLSSVAFGNGQFIVTAYPYFSATASDVFFSTDGVHWQDSESYFFLPAGMGGAHFVNGDYYIFSSGENDVSPDPYDWLPFTGPAPRIWAPQYQLYLAVGASGAVYTSTNRSTWVTRNSGTTNQLFDIAYGNNRFVAVGGPGFTGTGAPATIMLSASTIPLLAASNQLPAGIQLTISGGLGPTYQLQASSDLTTWTNLTTFTNIGAGTNYLDTTASNFPQRFYRTVSP
jgi:hypothetical protein